MNKKYQKIWNLAVKYLEKGAKKDFVLHTRGVIEAMQLILKDEAGNPDVLMPAAILHDVGWAGVPKKYQIAKDKKDWVMGLRLHIDLAPGIIEEILKSLNYKPSVIKEIVEVVKAHKFQKPRNLNKQILIDADQLSDAFKEQFYSDAKAYKIKPEKLYGFRIKDNKFYTKTAENIFAKEMKKREKELKV